MNCDVLMVAGWRVEGRARCLYSVKSKLPWPILSLFTQHALQAGQ